MPPDEPHVASYGLIVSFPDQSASFVHGFEAGKLDEQMKRGDVAEIESTTHVENREVLARLADAEGWSVETKPSEVEGWDYTKLVKAKPSREIPNPHGLRVIK